MEEMSTVDTDRAVKLFRSNFIQAFKGKNRLPPRACCSQIKAEGLSNISSFVADLQFNERRLDSTRSRKSIQDLFLGSTKDKTTFEFELDFISKNTFFKDAPPIEYQDRLDERASIATLVKHTNRMNRSINLKGRRSKSQLCLKAVKNDMFGIHI